jgi:hypothetical protein
MPTRKDRHHPAAAVPADAMVFTTSVPSAALRAEIDNATRQDRVPYTSLREPCQAMKGIGAGTRVIVRAADGATFPGEVEAGTDLGDGTIEFDVKLDKPEEARR